jgi:hypothetical protein
MTAVSFLIRDLATGARIGAAIVAIDARYASVLHAGAERIARRFVSASDWPTIERELTNVASGPIPARSTIARVLEPKRTTDVTVQVLAAMPIEEPPDRVAAALDAWLRTLAPPTVTLRQEGK